MNAIGMFFRTTASTDNLQKGTETESSDGTSTLFHGLLTEEQADVNPNNVNAEKEQNDLVDLPPAIYEELANMFSDRELELDEEQQILAQLTNNLPKEQENVIQGKVIDLINDTLVTDLKIKTNIQNDPVALKQLSELIAQVKAILANVPDKPIAQVAPKMLNILEQLAALDKKYNTGKSIFNNILTTEEAETKEMTLLKELLTSFQKRNQLVAMKQYNADAKVTSTDVAKWMHNALGSQQANETQVGTQHASLNSMPMSKIEQYVIHVNQTQSSESVDKQLIDQFQNVVKSSRFLAMNNGVNQLTITLRPENLGEMMIKLTEINGEMTVKILVSSLAAKKMLESNLHQLKNMFSPHQVAIEKQDMDVQALQKEQEEKEFNDEEESNSHQEDQDSNNDSGEDFEAMFNELLLNEKV